MAGFKPTYSLPKDKRTSRLSTLSTSTPEPELKLRGKDASGKELPENLKKFLRERRPGKDTKNPLTYFHQVKQKLPPGSQEAQLADALILSKDIVISRRKNQKLIIKNIISKTYLIVDRDQWDLLSRFQEAKSFIDIFPEIIRDRRSPAFVDLFELLLKAKEANILIPPGYKPERIAASNWTFELHYKIATFFSIFGIIFGLTSFLVHQLSFPTSLWSLLLGYLALPVCVSIGSFFAACVMRWFECEIYSPKIYWRTLIPHLRVDMDECPIGGYRCELCASLLMISPLFLWLGFSVWQLPELSLVAFAGLIYLLAPVNESPITLFLQGVFRGPMLSISHSYIFRPQLSIREQFKRKFRHLPFRYLAVEGLYAFGWLCMLFYLFYSIIEHYNISLLSGFFQSSTAQIVCLATLSILFGLFIWASLSTAGKTIARAITESKRPNNRLRTKENWETGEDIEYNDIIDLLEQIPLFERFATCELEEIADFIECRVYSPRETILKEGASDRFLYIVYDGNVKQYKRIRSGRKANQYILRNGSIFGDLALLENGKNNFTAKAKTKTAVLQLPKKAFQELILNRLGPTHIKDILYKESLLKRIPFSCNWKLETIKRFAEICVLNKYQMNHCVLQENIDNRFFFIIYEGTFSVMKKTQKIAKLHEGDFFGELGMLQNAPTNASVHANEHCQALSISKGDFLRFLVTDYEVAMQIEKIASVRLGRPVFPLDHQSLKQIQKTRGRN